MSAATPRDRIRDTLPSPRELSVVDVLTGLIYLFGVALTVLTIDYARTLRFPEPMVYANIFLGIGLALYYLMQAKEYLVAEPFTGRISNTIVPDSPAVRRNGARLLAVIAVAIAIASLLVTGYVHFNFGRLQSAYTVGYTTLDILVGLGIILILTDATRRAFGYIFTSVIVFSLVYAFVGPLLPGIFNHSGMSIARISREGAIGLMGTYSFILRIGSTWVAIFIMFAGIAKAYGALDYVLDVGREMGTSLRTGVVQIAVVASMIMGSITGSAAANTATTGSFTIPMIKDQGIRKDFAAAIEAVASSGGQMLPPVMGVAAFLMADILNVSYLTIIRAGIIPAALFYLSVGVAVYLLVLKFGWTTDEIQPFDYTVLLGGLHFVIPLAVLMYTLVILRFTPLAAGLYTIITIVGVMYVRNVLVDVLDVGVSNGSLEANTDAVSLGDIGWSVLGTTKQTLDGFKQGGVEMAPLVGILGSLGIILRMVEGTGLAGAISQQMVSLAGGVLFFLLVMAMISSILFGLGMPTPAAYILVAMLIVPSVIAVGIPPITAHMFVFYFAMLSAITPPVAVSVAIGSSIADSSFPRSCVQALRIGAPGFVIPFAFITNNSLIYWSIPETIIALPLVLAGTTALVVVTVGFDGAHWLSVPARVLYLVAALAAMFGGAFIAPLLTTTPTIDLGIQLVGGLAIFAGLGYANLVAGYDHEAALERTKSSSPQGD
ncbi:C4-dicarboxylate ABC transporter permease [Natrinema saccharevitans]|uniref:C4-dicarboxylate ABC transporter permease n=1 Tax=Natrinema saccharevitans TaxID=301967 RepID=A0A1S8AZQ8_9EURY|nr:TRAP transporter fused permease subunit [Natrinema saccharevitans]OLZ42107.1 C4-dicarboxylate ABC transporter permease [Natrinema saccharevitans]